MDPTRSRVLNLAQKVEHHALLESEAGSGRHCLVTVGATTTFRELVDEIISSSFLEMLRGMGYSSLTIQCGQDKNWALGKLQGLATKGLQVTVVDYINNMTSELMKCRGQFGVRLAGVLIGHAGSGTILAGRRMGVAMVVVPNPGLMDNHQAELAAAAAEEGWAVHGSLGALSDGLAEAQHTIIQGRMDDLPPYKESTFPVPEDERCKLFDWMVLT